LTGTYKTFDRYVNALSLLYLYLLFSSIPIILSIWSHNLEHLFQSLNIFHATNGKLTAIWKVFSKYFSFTNAEQVWFWFTDYSTRTCNNLHLKSWKFKFFVGYTIFFAQKELVTIIDLLTGLTTKNKHLKPLNLTELMKNYYLLLLELQN